MKLEPLNDEEKKARFEQRYYHYFIPLFFYSIFGAITIITCKLAKTSGAIDLYGIIGGIFLIIIGFPTSLIIFNLGLS